MRLRRLLASFSPAHLQTTVDVWRSLGLARRILTGHEPPPLASSLEAQPYDPLLVARLRLVAKRLGRLPGVSSAAAVTAAFAVVRRQGWPCSLDLGPDMALRLWDAPILTAKQVSRLPARTVTSGPKLAVTNPYLPPVTEPKVARITTVKLDSAHLSRLFSELGGLEKIIPPGSSVLLKANYNSYHPPPASTATDLLDAVVAELRSIGVTRLALGECSALLLGRTRTTLERAGIVSWARERDVELLCFDELPWQCCPVAGKHFRQIIVPACLPEFDRLCYLVSPKTHHQAGVSLGLKMTIGFMHPAQRLELHQDHLTERIAEASLAVQPHLVVMDARQCFITGGPAEGKVATPHVAMAAQSLLSLETAGLELLAEHGAVGVERGKEQLQTALKLLSG